MSEIKYKAVLTEEPASQKPSIYNLENNDLVAQFTNIASLGEGLGGGTEYLGANTSGYGITFSRNARQIDFSILTPNGKVISSSDWLQCN